MFEQKPNQNQPGGSPADQGSLAPPLPPTPPANLPTDEGPADFNEPEDILAGIDKPEVEAKDFGQSAPFPPPPVQPPKMAAELEPELPEIPPIASVPPVPRAESKEPFFKRYQKIIVIIVLVLIGGSVLAAGAWYGYNQFFAAEPSGVTPQSPVNNNLGQPSANQNVGVPTGIPNQPVNPPNINIAQPANLNVNDPNAAPPSPIDTDRDGLEDSEEALYGTNPLKVDTDEDGLTDRDEVKVFETDPNNPDTDGDTYLDGDEVRTGYDPKGSGRLFNIE